MTEAGVEPGWVLTGAGLVSPAGDTSAGLFEALLAGRPLSRTDDDGFPVVRIDGFDPKSYIKRKGLKHLSRTSQLACAAAAAVNQQLEGLDPATVGVVFGSAWASLDTIVRFEREAHTEGARFVDPLLFTETVANVPAGQVSIFYGWSAFNATIAAGTSGGIAAIERAVDLLREGRADIAVSGGGDAVNEQLLRTFHAEGRTAASLDSRPFDAESRGPVGSEGACFLVIESAAHAKARGAALLARLGACASRFVGDDPSDASPRAAMLEELLDRAGLERPDIDLVVLSGSGDPLWDHCETRVVAELFAADPPPACVPKAVLGETWAASGPLGAVIAIEAIRRSVVPARPAGVSEHGGLVLPQKTMERPIRNAMVLDCSSSGYVSALTVAPAEAA